MAAPAIRSRSTASGAGGGCAFTASLRRSISPSSRHGRFSVSRVASPTRARSPAARRKTCACSPTTHPGSYRCSLHKGRQQGMAAPGRMSARRSAMANSLVRIETVESGLVKRALAVLIRPCAHQQRRRWGFERRPSRLSVMSNAADLSQERFLRADHTIPSGRTRDPDTEDPSNMWYPGPSNYRSEHLHQRPEYQSPSARHGDITISVDAAFSQHKCTYAVLVLSDNNEYIEAMSGPTFASSSLHAELIAIYAALSQITKRCYTSVSLLSDSLQAVRLLHGREEEWHWNLVEILSDCKELWLHTNTFINHIPRGQNQLAHLLAQHCISSSSVLHCQPPECIADFFHHGFNISNGMWHLSIT